MDIQQLLEELRKHQFVLSQRRSDQLSANRQAKADLLRTQLAHALDVEDRLLKSLAECFDLLEKRPDDLHLPASTTAMAVPGSKRALPQGTQLEAVYKGKTIKASVNNDGKLMFRNKEFNSIAALANEVTGKEKNHLRNRKFWKITYPCGAN